MKHFVVTGIRLFLGLIFFTSGMAKLFHGAFPGIIGPVWLEERLAVYGLGLFARFVAYSQVIVGLLLLTQRFATLGALMLFPMLLNIWIVTISLQWQGTPYVNFVLLLLNATLLLADFHKLKFLFSDQYATLKATPLGRKWGLSDGFWAMGMVLIILSTLVFEYQALTAYVLIGLGVLTFLITHFGRRFFR